MIEKFIYNLEFPSYINRIKIGDYVFNRVSNYAEAFGKLQHLVTMHGQEFPVIQQTGSHQITALVEIPDTERPNCLAWEKDTKQIYDVLLLLTIFTRRNVFMKEWDNDKAIIQDHRMLQIGELNLSILEIMLKHIDTDELISKEMIKGHDIFDYLQIDIGFERGLNRILELISNKEWQEKYDRGYFLFLYRQAIQRQIVETSFILCWSIWEHIFTLHNRKWLDEKTIEKLSGYEKLSFILDQYFLVKIDNKAKQEISRLAKTRNRIVHYGKIANTDSKEMELFIRLTEQLVALILGLQPSNIFNTAEKLQEFLKGK
jgi:hypothetical protein